MESEFIYFNVKYRLENFDFAEIFVVKPLRYFAERFKNGENDDICEVSYFTVSAYCKYMFSYNLMNRFLHQQEHDIVLTLLQRPFDVATLH